MKSLTPVKFRKARKELGFTQSEFAEKLGYNRYQTILEKEKGILPITKQDLIIIKCLQKESKNV